MKRIPRYLSSLALVSLTGIPVLSQEGEWRPVSQHRARYESIDTQGQSGNMLGRPITGRSRVDQAVEPVSFGADQQVGLPLPPPPSRQNQFELAPTPRTTAIGYPQGGVPLQQAGKPVNNAPASGIPNGTVTYPMGEVITPVPQGSPVFVNGQPVVVNGQVVGNPVVGGTVIGDSGIVGECAGVDYGDYSGRYYSQALHGSPGIWYGSFDFQAFTLSKDQSPPLLITGPQTTTSIKSPGVTVLYGGTLDSDPMYGGKIMMGVWFNRSQTWGMYGSFFSTGTVYNNFSVSSPTGSPFLARPFFDVNPATPPGEALEAVANLGVAGVIDLGGTVDINRTSLLRGGELNFRFNWLNNLNGNRRFQWNIDSYMGVKYIGLDESLTITENLTGLQSNTDVNDRGKKFFVQDSFSTRNMFIGGNLGLLSEARLGRFFVETRGGVALGANMQQVDINGVTVITPGVTTNPPKTFVGGVLALPSNMGQHNTTQFGIIPEFGLKLGLQITDHMRIYAGYDMSYWTNVVRPGQQIDYSSNSSQFPNDPQPPLQGSARPAFNFNTSNLWISSFSAGLSWVF